MSLKKCKSCNGDVSKTAKKCPHCGQKLKMGVFMKLFLGFLTIMVLMFVLIGVGAESVKEERKTVLENLYSANPDQINIQEIEQMFNPFKGSKKYTDLQRNNKLKDLKGKIIEASLYVYEVKKRDEKHYRIQTHKNLSAFVDVYIQSEKEVDFLNQLKTNDLVKIRGVIEGTSFLRNINIDPAIIIF